MAQDILQAHPDLAAIFGINDDSALGALAAVEKAGKVGRVTIIGFDAVPEARAAIQAGKTLVGVEVSRANYEDAFGPPVISGNSSCSTLRTVYCKGWAFETHGRKMLNRDFKPAFKVGLQQKDLRLVLEAADSMGVPMPGTGLICDVGGGGESIGPTVAP